MATGFTTYNGQQVATDDWTKQNITANAKAQGIDPMEYDKSLNPTTYGARWGIPDGSTNVAPTPSSPGSGGLLNPAPPPITTAANGVASYGPTTYDPTKQVMSGTSSVQNQLANITSNGSQLNTLAAADADRQSNRRGLLNSSIAVGAAQKSVLQSALPIAQQDASTSAGTDSANANFANSASQFNAGSMNAAGQFNAGAQNSVNLANIQARAQQAIADNNNKTNLAIAGNDNATKTLLQSMDAASKLGLANIDADTKVKLTNLDAQSKVNLQTMLSSNQQLLQTNISASNIFSQYMTNLANISTNDKMDEAAKQRAADNQINALNAQLQAIGQISGLDLSKYFQPVAVTTPPPSTQPSTDNYVPRSEGSDGGG